MGDDDHSDLAGLLFGYIVYRELRDGRLDAGEVLRAGCLVTLVIGAVIGGVLLLAWPRSSGDYTRYEPPTAPAMVAPLAPETLQPGYASPRPMPAPSPTPKSTPKPTSLPGIGKRVSAGDGWAVTVTKVRRWRPSWYDEPGWRLITAYVKVRMPASDTDCVWGDMFFVTARSGREYRGWQEGNRKPDLFACGDYHRATTASGWVTFEVRNKDAKGLVLTACPGDLFWCEGPGAKFRLP